MSLNTAVTSTVSFTKPERAAAFEQWFASAAPAHVLQRATLTSASADASFRRYFRALSASGDSFIIMDAPPEQENCSPFVRVARLMHEAGVPVPQVLAWDEVQGFMLLTDLGRDTMLQAIETLETRDAMKVQHWYLQAIDALVKWQRASKPGALPPYDEALLRREVQLYPDWYVKHHRKAVFSPEQQAVWMSTTQTLIAHNLAVPSVFVHRDFMPRNLMIGSSALGVLDFQDAVYGPITYDIACLMRDAFLSWPEDFVIDMTVRYWEAARAAGLPVHQDFGEFYKAVEWMGLQRHLKVLGIFARIHYRDGKPKYLSDTPRFLDYVRHTTKRYAELAPLYKLVNQLEEALNK